MRSGTQHKRMDFGIRTRVQYKTDTGRLYENKVREKKDLFKSWVRKRNKDRFFKKCSTGTDFLGKLVRNKQNIHIL